MIQAKGFVLRNIARNAVERLFGDIEQAEELATSLIRQWRTCDGRATLLSPTARHDFILTSADDSFKLDVEHYKRFRLEPLLQRLGIDVTMRPYIMHRLNVSQSVEVENQQGRMVRLWFDPREDQVYGEGPHDPKGHGPFCPNCSAVLPLSGDLRCRHCGQ